MNPIPPTVLPRLFDVGRPAADPREPRHHRDALGLRFLHDARANPLAQLERLREQHGGLCITRVLGRPVVDVFDPVLARELLVGHASRIERWGRVPQVFARYHGRGSLLAAEGDEWAHLHRRLAPAFTPRALAAAGAAVTACADEAVRDAMQAGTVAVVDMQRLFTRLSMQVIERVLFGENKWGTAQLDALSALTREMSALALREFFFPWVLLQRLPGSAADRRRRAALRELDRALSGRPVVAEGLRALDRGELRANLRTLFFAGHDTTAQALLWWSCLMAHHPAALARAQRELDEVLTGRMPEAAALASLPWLTASVKEALRLYPPLPVLAMRCLREDVVLDGRTLPRGAVLRISPWLLHRDPSIWPDPTAFRPERFLDDAASGAARGAWMPFGAGPRACIGRHLALLEMGLAAAVLVQRCTPQPLVGAAMPAHQIDVVLRPRGQARLMLAARS